MRLILAITAFCVATIAGAQNTAAPNAQNAWNPDEVLKKEGWVEPPAVVERIITANRADQSYATPSPDRKWFVRTAIGGLRGSMCT